MWALAQAGLGWVIGTIAPSSDRRLRMWCAAAALLPEADALARLAGVPAPLGHNFFAGVLCLGASGWAFRTYPPRTWLAALFFVALAFSLHLALDAKVAGRELALFWPLDRRSRQFQGLLPPGSPIHYVLAGLLLALPWVLAYWKKVTPLEILSPGLDTLFLNLFRNKKYDCRACGKACNHRCRRCAQPVCFRHGKIGKHFLVTCESCAGGRSPTVGGGGVEDYVARELSFFRGKEAVRLDPEFAGFLYRKLRDGLRRLDDVPRTHPLWQGSDQRPTLAKLVDLSRTILKDAPDDEESRWVLFADRVLKCSPDLEYSIIEPVILKDFGSIRWMVAAARWSYVFSGVNPVLALKAPLERLGKAVGSMEPFLQELQKDKDPGVQDAAARCLDLLQGRNPFKA